MSGVGDEVAFILEQLEAVAKVGSGGVSLGAVAHTIFLAVMSGRKWRELEQELRYYRGRAAVDGKPMEIRSRDELLFAVRELEHKLGMFDSAAMNMLMDARRGDAASVVARIEKLYEGEAPDATQQGKDSA